MQEIDFQAQKLLFFYYFLNFYSFCFFRTALRAYGGSQARGLIGAVAAGLHHSHSHAGSELRLRPTPQRTAVSEARDRTLVLMDTSQGLNLLSYNGNSLLFIFIILFYFYFSTYSDSKLLFLDKG